MSGDASGWDRAALALRLLNIPNGGLGGAVIRMRAGPARDRVLSQLSGLHLRKMHPTISDDQLFGGLDLAATLGASQAIENKSFFYRKCNALLVMAERCGVDLAAKLTLQIDADAGHQIIALDEGAETDEQVPAKLADRLAFHIAPEGRMPDGWPSDVKPVPAGTETIDPGSITATDADIETLTELAAVFGIDSLRAPWLALRVARAHAAFRGRTSVTDEDLNAAAELTYPHRATRVPPESEAAETDPPAPPEDAPEDQSDGDSESLSLPDGDMLVEAVRALLPPDLLAGLVPAGTTRSRAGSGAGQKRKGNRRGRPLPSRPGRLDGRTRIDLVATLRAAAPWQPLRRWSVPHKTGLHIRPSDIRLRRYQEHSDRLLIFTVDASGSAAVARLGEAKGAVELLLGQAYAARDHVALIAFRGDGAELLLPPTRSLVQTKRRLASLPGGGGTPLAAGLQQAALLAAQSRSKGLSPTVVILTDGRANIALDGTPNRAAAQADAEKMAQLVRAEGIAALVIDMSNRPQEPLRALAGALSAPYIALPRADAERLTGAVSAALSP